MKYSEVFSTSWKIVWKFKALWIFGLLSSCMRSIGGGSSSSSSGGGGSSLLPSQQYQPISFSQGGSPMTLWQLRLEEQPGLVILLILALFLLVLALIAVVLLAGTLGRVGVARGAWLADSGSAHLGFGLLLKESWPYFWRVFLLFLLIGFAGLVVASILIAPIILVTIISFGLIWLVLIPFLLPLAILFIGLALAINALIEEAVVAIVGENLGVFDAIERAWKLLWQQPLRQLLISLASSLLQMGATFLLVLPVFILLIPLLISLPFQSQAALSIGAAVSGLSFVVYIPLVVVATGILHAYIGSLWTITFRRLAGLDPVAATPLEIAETS